MHFLFSVYVFYLTEYLVTVSSRSPVLSLFLLEKRKCAVAKISKQLFTVLLLEQLNEWRKKKVLRPRNELPVCVRVFSGLCFILRSVAVVLLDLGHKIRRRCVLWSLLRRLSRVSNIPSVVCWWRRRYAERMGEVKHANRCWRLLRREMLCGKEKWLCNKSGRREQPSDSLFQRKSRFLVKQHSFSVYFGISLGLSKWRRAFCLCSLVQVIAWWN